MTAETVRWDDLAQSPAVIGHWPGALIYRSVHLRDHTFDEHRHEGVSVTIPLLGGLRATFDDDDCWLSGPAVAVHPVGAVHAGETEWMGLEAIELELDPHWLRYIGGQPPPNRSLCSTGGRLGREAHALARACVRAPAERDLAKAVRRFFNALSQCSRPRQPRWIDGVNSALLSSQRISTDELARLVGMNPQWLSEAYRDFSGEGLQARLRRQRVEAASIYLRYSSSSLAEVANATGFCDQSHMNRVFKRTLGRTPLEVRGDAQRLARSELLDRPGN